MHHRITYLYINFQQNRVIDQSKQYTQIYLQLIASCMNLQLLLIFFYKLIVSDMHYHVTYMYINFQQNRTSRSVKTVHTNLFANNRKLHKFVTCNLNFETKLLSDIHNPNVNI